MSDQPCVPDEIGVQTGYPPSLSDVEAVEWLLRITMPPRPSMRWWVQRGLNKWARSAENRRAFREAALIFMAVDPAAWIIGRLPGIWDDNSDGGAALPQTIAEILDFIRLPPGSRAPFRYYGACCAMMSEQGHWLAPEERLSLLERCLLAAAQEPASG